MDQQTQEEDDKPRRAAETAFVAHKLWRHLSQKYTHSKVRKRQQGNPTCKPSRQNRNWNTLTQGAKPQLPHQASGAGEAQKIPVYLQQGKQCTGTEEKVAARPLQPNLRVDQQTGDRHANPLSKGAEPRRGSCAGTKKKTRGEQDNCYKTTHNPMRNHHRRSRAANLSQPAGEPQKGRQLHDTEQKNRRCSMTSRTDTPRRLSKSLRHP